MKPAFVVATLAIVFAPTAARADSSAALQSAPQEPTTSYRSITVTADAIMLSALIGGAVYQSGRDGAPITPVFATAAVGSLLTVPIIHGLRGFRERSPASFGMRLGLGLLGGFVAYQARRDCIDGILCEANNVDFGIIAGVAVASIIDNALLTSEPAAATTERVVAPQLAPTRGGAVVGLGGSF